MPNNNTANVSVGKGVAGGYFFTAPHGTTLPTDITTQLNNAFINCGFISDEGIVNSTDSQNDTYRDLNGDDIATATSSRTRTISVHFVEMMAHAMKEVYGQTNVTESNGVIHVTHKNTDMEHRSVVMELVLRDGRRWRRIVPDAQVTDWNDMTIVSSSLVDMGVTYTLNADTNGQYIIDIIESTDDETESTNPQG